MIACTYLLAGWLRSFVPRAAAVRNRGPQMLATQVDSFDDPPVYCCVKRYVAVEYNNRERVSLSLIAYISVRARG